MELDAFLIFATTTTVIILSPGATAILVASQGASNGWKVTFFSIFGIMLATAIYFLLSATGLASLILASNFLFQVIKWIGVAYLIYLGAMAIFNKSGSISVQTGDNPQSKTTLFSQGFIVEFANPKALFYFAAILPQFLDLAAPLAPQMMIMGATGTTMQLVIYLIYAKMGDRLANGGVHAWIVDLINKVAGAALIFAGIKMAGVTASR